MDGLALFEKIQTQWLGMPVIIMTAHGTIPDAIQATRSGVFSFLTKPIDKDDLLSTIEHALSLTRPKQKREWQSQILTRNPQMEQILIQASTIATMEVPVLILGPSGSGKGLMAHTLHQASARREQPLYAINCAALSWEALDQELFGEDGRRHIRPGQGRDPVSRRDRQPVSLAAGQAAASLAGVRPGDCRGAGIECQPSGPGGGHG